ncbi:hypothetical protein ACF07D_08590 [Leucobacter sp. NPDC015123]|uniref:hypothetical protein n=1 Tax=Leucobacter sp. NPDC015123 TaxID=3364129 RepID=UPI0036F45C6D
MAAIIFTAIVGALGIFQIAAAAGAPVGAYCWGGQHCGKLPVGLRIGSAATLLLYAALVLVILSRAGILGIVPEPAAAIGTWVIFGYCAIGIVMNGISRSKRERLVMTPVVSALAVLALIVALQG